MMLLEGMPLLLLELGIGQKMRTGSLGVWNRVHPYLGGIGLGSTVIAVVVGCYYNMIIAWCLFYLYYSMRVSFLSARRAMRFKKRLLLMLMLMFILIFSKMTI